MFMTYVIGHHRGLEFILNAIIGNEYSPLSYTRLQSGGSCIEKLCKLLFQLLYTQCLQLLHTILRGWNC